MQEMVNDIQFLDTQSSSMLIFPQCATRLAGLRHGDQLIE